MPLPRTAFFQVLVIWTVLIIATIGITSLFGTPVTAAISYATYMALFVIVPGTALLASASRRASTPAMFAAKSIIIGQAFEMAVGLIVTIAGVQQVYQFLPLLYISVFWIYKKRITECIHLAEHSRGIILFACTLVAVFLVFSASLSDFSTIIDHHYTWVAAFANAVNLSWPPVEPFLMDVPLHYHYLYNVHVGLAANTAGIPLIFVAARLAMVFHAFVLILVLYAFAEARLKAGWLGIVAATALLLTFGYSEIMWKDFHFATAQIMYRVASTIIAFQLFIMLMDEILASKRERIHYWLIVGLILVGSGTRVNMLPMLAAGVGLLMLSKMVDLDRKKIGEYAVLLATIVGGIVFSAVFFLGVGSGVSDGTNLIMFNPLNIPVSEWAEDKYAPIVQSLLAMGAPNWVASLVYLVVAICGRMTFLLPGVLFAFVSPAINRDLRVILTGVVVAGIGLLVLIETTVPQEIWTFYWYADIAIALIGAAGLYALWLARQHASTITKIGLLATCLIFAVQVTEFSVGFFPKLVSTQFPMPQPEFHDQHNDVVAQTLANTITAGDVLVTGGKIEALDDRTFAAAVPGIQLYGSRYILTVYATRTSIDPLVASRLWIIDNNLSQPADRARVKQDVGPHRALYFLWVGTSRFDTKGMTLIKAWEDRSLWKVE